MYLISACLCGVNCKYNGANNYNEKCNELFISGKAVLICPEQLGGLTTPRVPSELQGNAKDVIEVRDIKEANEYGYEIAEDVVESYDCFDDDEDIEQELEWRIYKIKEGISADEARAALGSYDEDGFVAEYCEEEVLS